jgi:hypothetical protein
LKTLVLPAFIESRKTGNQEKARLIGCGEEFSKNLYRAAEIPLHFLHGQIFQDYREGSGAAGITFGGRGSATVAEGPAQPNFHGIQSYAPALDE